MNRRKKIESTSSTSHYTRVVLFIKSAKGTEKQAVDIFEVSLPAVKKIWKEFKQDGLKALNACKRGSHNSRSLISRSKVAEITHFIKKGTPDSYNLPYYLWTANV